MQSRESFDGGAEYVLELDKGTLAPHNMITSGSLSEADPILES